MDKEKILLKITGYVPLEGREFSLKEVLEAMDLYAAQFNHSPKPDVSETKHNCIYRPGDENYEG